MFLIVIEAPHHVANILWDISMRVNNNENLKVLKCNISFKGI